MNYLYPSTKLINFYSSFLENNMVISSLTQKMKMRAVLDALALNCIDLDVARWAGAMTSVNNMAPQWGTFGSMWHPLRRVEKRLLFICYIKDNANTFIKELRKLVKPLIKPVIHGKPHVFCYESAGCLHCPSLRVFITVTLTLILALLPFLFESSGVDEIEKNLTRSEIVILYFTDGNVMLE